VAGRDHVDLEPLIGFFLNTLLFRHQIQMNERFIDLMQKVKGTTINGLDHQHYPFDELVNELNIPRDLNRFPGASVLVNVLNYVAGELPMEQHEPCSEPLNWDMKIELEFFVMPKANGIQFYCQYRSALFRHELIEYLMSELIHLLGQIANSPNTMVKDFDILLPERRIDSSGGKLSINSPYLEFIE
jgi:non-ribosomal peptide synthetase component F